MRGNFSRMRDGVAVADACKTGIDLTDAAASADQRVKLLGRCGSDGHARAIVEDDVERFDVVNDFAAEQAMHAATVVADHAAESAAGMGRRIRRVGKLMQLRGVAQTVENDAGLNASEPLVGVQRLKRIHEARKVKDHRHVDALAGEAGTSAAGKHGGTGGAAGGQPSLNVGGIARKNNADGKLAVVRSVSGVKSARAGIKMHFSAKRFL